MSHLKIGTAVGERVHAQIARKKCRVAHSLQWQLRIRHLLFKSLLFLHDSKQSIAHALIKISTKIMFFFVSFWYSPSAPLHQHLFLPLPISLLFSLRVWLYNGFFPAILVYTRVGFFDCTDAKYIQKYHMYCNVLQNKIVRYSTTWS